MDYYRTSTEILDSWDFINLPIARPYRDQNRERSTDDNRPNAYEQKCARRKLHRQKESFRHRKKLESCTSLILEKTDKQVLNQYSVFSYTNINQSHGPVYGDYDAKHPAPRKPVIKVTIIPNTDKKTGKKRIETLKKSTIKKINNFTNLNKNVYFVVTGRTNQIVHLKTITAQFSEGKLQKNDCSTNECATIEELFKVNVNKCKKSLTKLKNKSTKVDDELLEYGLRCDSECGKIKFIRREKVEYIKMSKNKGNAQRTNKKAPEELRMTIPIKGNSNLNRESPKTSPRTSTSGEKSRIRITGRLGLNKDDKYVLKCNATLDDEPIATIPANEDVVTMLCLDQEGKRSLRNQRDCKVQADVRCYPPGYGQTSQATQVNFEIFYPQKHNNTKIFANNDNIIQCYCTNTSENISDERGDVPLKECASPIVIISVYPQQESTDKVTNRFNVTEDKTKCPAKAECSERNVKKVMNIEEAKTKPKPTTRSRSPSPARNTKEKTNKEVNTNQRTRVNVSNSKKQLGDTTNSTVKTSRIKSTKPQTVGQVSSVTNKKTERSKSPVSSKLSPTRKTGEKQKTKNTTGTNTEQRLAKKTLVENFTKQYTARMNGKNRKDVNERSAVNTKHDVSNVTINIEGDNEFYNVMFHQSPLDTDVTVRKTPKGIVSNFARDNDSTSLENFLLSEHDASRVNTSFSQAFFREPDGGYPTLPTTSKINIRDSIQVCHWREEKHSNDDKTHTGSSSNRNEVDNVFLAPTKHFQGDECSISDPNERDREIRDLLGIDSRNFKPPAQKSAENNTIFRRSSEVPLTYLYRDHSVNVCQGKSNDLISTSVQNNPSHLWILNRNIKVLLQFKRSNKQSIMLSRQQYAKVKRAIYANILKKYSLGTRKRLDSIKYSSISIGSIKSKPKEDVTFHYNKGIQTELDMILFHDSGTKYMKETNHCESNPLLCGSASTGETQQDSLESKEASRSLHGIRSLLSNVTDKHKRDSEQPEVKNYHDASFNSSQRRRKHDSSHKYPRRAASAVDVQYAELAYLKKVKLPYSDLSSKAHLKDLGLSKNSNSQNFEQKESHSIHTIFKGRRRCHSPNLGTSAYSLCPGTYENVSEYSNLMFMPLKDPVSGEQKSKKPFLRRLISCLVFRASGTSAAKLPNERIPNNPSIPSSIDWYYINSSLCSMRNEIVHYKPRAVNSLMSQIAGVVGPNRSVWGGEIVYRPGKMRLRPCYKGIDMSSSLYDTTASFYSNHTILPVAKMKRGFFSSVREFLASRRS